MKCTRRRGLTGLGAIAALVAAVPLAQSATSPDPAAGQGPLVPIYIVGQQEDLLAIPGTVQAAERTELAFQAGGTLIELPIVAGQRVAAGEVLARLDRRDFEARVRLEQARLTLARADYERFSRLVASPTSPVSPAEVERKRAVFETARARATQAAKNLEDATLRAPFEGVIAATLVDNHVQIRSRQPVLVMENADVLEVVIDLPEWVVARVRSAPRDRPVGEVRFAVLPERGFPVAISEVATRADPTTQTFRTTLTLERPRDVNLLPGMTAMVYGRPEVIAEEVLRVPVTAIFRTPAGQSAVWVVDAESYRIEQRSVTLREDGSASAVVLDGLAPGERIVRVGAGQLQAGTIVRPFRTGMLSE
jgi:multidrug efflux system membrane fusion protein